MSGFGLSVARFQARFFDRAVAAAADKARVRGLARWGAAVRTVARRSMRYGTKPSAPGRPPTAHKGYPGPLIRELLYFAYDPQTRTTVVGPAALNGGRRRAATVPQLHEYGGAVPGEGRVIYVKRAAGRDQTERVELTGRVRYPARPYMRPAEEAVRPRAATFFKDTFRAAA